MEGLPGIRPVRRFRVLIARDANAPTCNSLLFAVEDALVNVDLTDASSLQDARAALDLAPFHVCLVCLDLPPAPRAGVRLAQQILGREEPVVLITRSLRWIPDNAKELRDLPWISPDAGAAEVKKAVDDAIARARVVEEPASHRVLISSHPSLDRAAPPWLEADGPATLRSRMLAEPRVVAFGRRPSRGEL